MDLDAPINLEKEDLSTDLEQVSITISNLTKMKRIRARFDDTQILKKLSALRDEVLVDMETTFRDSGIKRIYSSNVNEFMSDYHLWKESMADDDFLRRLDWDFKTYSFVIEEAKKGVTFLFQNYSPRQLQTMISILVEYRVNESTRLLKERCVASTFSEFTELVGKEFKLKQGEENIGGLFFEDHKRIIDLLNMVYKYSNLSNHNNDRKNIKVGDLPNYLRIPVSYTGKDDEKILSELRDLKLKDLTKTLDSCGMKEIALFKLNEILHDYQLFIEQPSSFDFFGTASDYKDCVKMAELSEEELFKYSPRVLTFLVTVLSRYRFSSHNKEMISRKKKVKDFKKYTSTITNEFRRPGIELMVDSVSQSTHIFMIEKLKTIHKYRCLVE